LDEKDLALYALFFMGGVLAMLVPQQVGLLPYRLLMNANEIKFRPDYGRSMRLALPAYGIAIPLVFATGLPVAGQNSIGAFLWTAAAASAWCVASSFQDHVRLSLHAGELHWAAATVSIVNCGLMALVAVVLFIFPREFWSVPAFPFAALILTNSVSALFGIRLSMVLPRFSGLPEGNMFARSRFLISDLIVQGTGYLSTAAVGTFVGVVAVANLEATRVAVQPVFILTAAVASIGVPRLIRSYAARNFPSVRHIVKTLMASSLLIGGVYTIIIWVGSGLLSILLGRPFDGMLAASRSSASTLGTAAGNINPLYYVSNNTMRLSLISILSAVAGLIATAAAIPTVGVYAVPICIGVAAGVRLLFVQYDLRHRLTRA
jgi:O-antigen/teichoic acid export membrane protein